MASEIDRLTMGLSDDVCHCTKCERRQTTGNFTINGHEVRRLDGSLVHAGDLEIGRLYDLRKIKGQWRLIS